MFGKSRSEIHQTFDKVQIMLKESKNFKLTRFALEEKTIGINMNGSLTFMELNIEKYSMPYWNFTTQYFFNSDGICDSIAMTENACLDCAELVSKENIYRILITWKKQSDGTYKSTKPVLVEIDEHKKRKSEKFAYLEYTRDDMPPDGTCRKLFFKMYPFEKEFKKRFLNHFVQLSL